ncbi:MAG TPA: hypothetical protein DCG28_01400 [Lachnospiraceae bacterium]|nr:hypothetical protein [Lachnospiraceae bacterium]
MTDSRKLKAVIIEKGFTQDQIAELIGMSSATFSYKLNNKVEFKASEILIISKVLELTTQQTMDIFFAENVENKSTKLSAST